MSLQIEDRYLGATPTEFIGAGRARLESQLKAQLAKMQREFTNKMETLAKQAGLPFIPTNPSQIPGFVAERLLKELNIPIPTKFTPDSLLQMAKALRIPQLPFPLPTRLPKNIADFVQQGLELAATQYGPQLLAYVGLGSVVPGLGNIIGVAIAIGKMAAELFKDIGKPYKEFSRYVCYGRLPGNDTLGSAIGDAPGKTPVEMIVYMQDRILRANVVRNTGFKAEKGRGEYYPDQVLQCVTNSTFFLRHKLYPASAGSADGATLPEVQSALRLFTQLKNEYSGALWEKETKDIHTAYLRRFEQLQNIGMEFKRIMDRPLPPAALSSRVALSNLSAEVNRLKHRVLQEVRTAGVAVQSHGKPVQKENLKQFAFATSMYSALDARHNEINRRSMISQGREPGRVDTLKENQFRFEMGQCDTKACEDRVRAKYGKATSTKPAPAPPPRLAAMQWKNWLKVARADQVARRPVTPPPPLPKLNPPGTPPQWAVWLNRVRQARRANKPVPFPPAIPAAWVK